MSKLRHPMKDLRTFRAPGEPEAFLRTWPLVRTAYAQREPLPRRHLRPRLLAAAAVAVALAVTAAALSPPGQALVDKIREAVGVQHPEPALFSLPSSGRLLVSSDAGVWVVQADGSKRLLAGWLDASWSPFGRYLVAARQNELAALEPDGSVHWTLARAGVRSPRWAGSRTDTRIAYLRGRQLRVVGGDGRADRLLDRRVAPLAPAWRPGHPFQLAYLDQLNRVRIVDADRGTSRGLSRPYSQPRQLAWSTDGKILYLLTADGLQRLDAQARPLASTPSSAGAAPLGVAPRPGGGIALTRPTAEGSELLLGNRRVLAGPGLLTDLAWSPNGRWLAVAWPQADQLVFVRAEGTRRIDAAANVKAQFETASFPRVAGWCCARNP